MQQEGTLTSEWRDAPAARRRKYYIITPKGREVLSEQAAEWSAFIEKFLPLLKPASGKAGS
jgi:PadR family transcriptional regulator PadR